MHPFQMKAETSFDSHGATFIFDDIDFPSIYLCKLFGMKTKKLPSRAKKGSEEKNSFRGVVLIGVRILGWPVITI